MTVTETTRINIAIDDYSLGILHMWPLDPNIVFLDHGAFGACPSYVLARQKHYRDLMERQPIHFYDELLLPLLDNTRQQLARFLGAQPHNIALVPNTTVGLNTVLRSLRFQSNDEILVTDQEFPATRKSLEYVANRDGAIPRIVALPLPIRDPWQVVDTICSGVTPRTRLAIISHVTSPTALVLPISAIVSQLRIQGIQTLIDGAHAPGMLPLKLDELGATYYVGDCHKWLCAPKASGFLHVQPDSQSEVFPVVSSYHPCLPDAGMSRFPISFLWHGTADYTPHICVPDAINHLNAAYPGGWPAIMSRNHDLVLQIVRLITESTGCHLLAPESMIGSMVSVPLDLPYPPSKVHRDLLHQFSIEVPLIACPSLDCILIRVSAQLYNTFEDGQRLNEGIQAIRASATRRASSS